MSVAGCTRVRIERHSTNDERATSVIRVASSARRGFTWRSMYNASCFLRKRFSAASWVCDLTAAATKRTTSTQRRKTRAAMLGETGSWSLPCCVISDGAAGRELSTQHGSDLVGKLAGRSFCGPQGEPNTMQPAERSPRCVYLFCTCTGIFQRFNGFWRFTLFSIFDRSIDVCVRISPSAPDLKEAGSPGPYFLSPQSNR